MYAALPYLSAKDDYSLFKVYEHTALKAYSPFLRNQDFRNPFSHADINTPIHSSITAFRSEARGISSEDARIAIFSDRCDTDGCWEFFW